MNDLKNELDKIKNDKANTQQKKNLLDQRNSALTEEINLLEAQIELNTRSIAANEALGMGEGRCVAFSMAFDKALIEIVHTCLEDTPDIEYTKEVVDRKLKAICGDHFAPWEVRYRHGD